MKIILKEIENHFRQEMERGYLDVIAPHPEYYPDPARLRQTLGDDMARVWWRSKQNLDYAFLMMYCLGRGGQFYVQLEDDIKAANGFVSVMRNFAIEASNVRENWLMIDFSGLGFIGKLFKSSNLPYLIQFLLMFHNEKPCDWLIQDLLESFVCSPVHTRQKCNIAKSECCMQYKNSLFQHLGTHSSLRGKVQKLKASRFFGNSSVVEHLNPKAVAVTNLSQIKGYSLQGAYEGQDVFFGAIPRLNSTLNFKLDPPVQLTYFKIVSGSSIHPEGTTTKADVSLRTVDNFLTKVGTFSQDGVAEGKILSSLGEISQVIIELHEPVHKLVLLTVESLSR